MSRPCLTRRLAVALLVTLAVSATLPGCSAIESLTGKDSLSALADLPATMQKVTDLSSNIADWSAGIMGFVSDPQLDQLGDFASQAGELLSSLQGASDGAGDAATSGLSSITDMLGRLSSFNVQDLLPKGQPERMESVGEFTGIADSLGQLATDFLSR